ncbi:MAG: hydroxymethylpyrimidine/phosphomethylpyrimidine kinase [Burkholderiales bacterium]|jgi:hydroxymethylpyrimidine/phosphomethylpyrimidine kinase|nr:hydroxymethylpyrimidine/phosphomethylpyrimidine kinase [Burkholderiales bacterium]
MSHPPPIVLSFAPTDATGGTGLQADLLTLAAMGCHPLTVATAVSVRDTAGIDDFAPLDSDIVGDQARLVLEDMAVSAFKVGMVGSIDNAAAIAAILADYPEVPVVLDPALAEGAGEDFDAEQFAGGVRDILVPLATVVIANAGEARRLAASEDDDDEPSLDESASRLLAAGADYVLVTGAGDDPQAVLNTLYGEKGVVRSDSWERLPGTFHGAGATLSAAVAAAIANGLEVPEAVREAQEYAWQSLAEAFRPGMGHHVPDRFFWARELDEGEGEA